MNLKLLKHFYDKMLQLGKTAEKIKINHGSQMDYTMLTKRITLYIENLLNTELRKLKINIRNTKISSIMRICKK